MQVARSTSKKLLTSQWAEASLLDGGLVHKDIARAVVQSDKSESLDIIEILDLATAAKAGLDELATVEGLSDITKSEHSELKYILTYILKKYMCILL
jgi:hypothetical protein